MSANLKDVITVEEVARRLGLARNTAYEAISRGEIPSIRIGRRILVPIVAFEWMLTKSASTAP